MKRRGILSFCGWTLGGLTGCLSGNPQDEADGDATGSNGVSPDTDTLSPTITETALSTGKTATHSAPPSPVVGGTISATPGDTVEIPFTVTNTGSHAIDQEPVLNVDLAYFPTLSLADVANVSGSWADDFEDRTTWSPPDLVRPGETVTARLPVTVAESARGLYAVRGEGQVTQLTATARA